MKYLFFIALLFLSVTTNWGQVIYVDKDATGADNGTSWNDAYTNLGTAINAASAGAEIRITIGVYGYNNQSFTIDKNITITGGFDGFETDGTPSNSIENYNPNLFNGTQILGDGNQALLIIDGTTANGDITSSTVIQNIVLSNSFNKPHGIEILGDNTSQNTDPTIKDCIFNSFNRSAVKIDGTNGKLGVTIDNCTFRYNGDSANNSTGGAIEVIAPNSTSTVTIRHSTFQYNDAKDTGGAIYTTGCEYVYILDSEFTENKVSTGSGGALGIFDCSFLGIANTHFSGNTASNGGAMILQSIGVSGSASILGSTFSGNTATSNGGAIYSFYVFLNMERGKFYDNTAPSGGGAIVQANAGGTISNCVFTGNNGGSAGNMLFSFYDENDSNVSSPFSLDFINCSISQNKNSSNAGTTVYMNHIGNGSTDNFTNCIFWDNGSSEIQTFGNATGTLNHSILDDGNINGTVQLPTNVTGSNNLDSDPLFNSDTLNIGCESPAVDMGTDAISVGTIDITGNNRNVLLTSSSNSRDIGAYEVQSRAICDCNDEGMSCDDMNPNTYNDVYDEACNCAGIPFSDGCVSGDTEQLGVEGDLNVSFTTINALSCTGGTLTGEAHITYKQYLMDDWFVMEGLACNEDAPIIIRRPKRLREENQSVARNNYDYCFMETWEIENPTCVSDILAISVYVYRDDVISTNLTLDQNPIPQDLYLADNQINSQGTVATNDTVDFVAGTTIILGQGFTATSGSNFTARIVAPPSCNAPRVAPITPPTDILIENEPIEQPNLTVYPNPASIAITINYQVLAPSKINLGLFSLGGQLLETITNKNIENTGIHSSMLNVENYPKGIYLIQLQTEHTQQIKKIVIQ